MSINRLMQAGLVTSVFCCPIVLGQGYVAEHGMPVTPANGQVSAKLHPSLVRISEGSEGAVKAWVFFTDKGVGSDAEYVDAIRQVAQTYNARAVRRRRLRGQNVARGGALFDERDLPVVTDYVDQVVATGAQLHVVSKWLNAVSVWAQRDQLDAMASLPFVRSLRPVMKGRRIDDDGKGLKVGDPVFVSKSGEAGEERGSLDYGLALEQLTQINLVALHDAGATGSGVIIGLLDTGFRRDHVAFHHPDKPLNVIAEFDFLDNDGNAGIDPGDPSAQHVHGTLILGTIASYAPGELVGAAFDASYILCKTEDTTAEYPAEEDNYVAGLEFIEANGGDVVNSSLGYIDWYTQDDLDGKTAVTTIAVNVATANGVHCCTSAGNNGNDADPTTSRILAPADAYQVLAVGAVDEFGLTSVFSADGPSADGRVKPEVMARGVDTFTIAAESTVAYNAATGTSISSPLVAGAVACLVQLHPTWTVDQMRNVLLHTAGDFVANGTYDPLFVRGYGIINAHDAGLDCNLNALLDECDISCGPIGGACDLPGCGGSADCNSDGIPDDCEPDCNINGVADSCDLAACDPFDALCQDCNRNSIPDECDEPFPPQGTIEIDQPTYICESTATVRVDDCGLDTDPGVVETVQVVVQSDSEPVGETVWLTETGAGTGAFTGTITLSAVDGTGVLLVADSDIITASYVDADDGLGGVNVTVTAQAAVDCTPPAVFDVHTDVPGPFDATVTCKTDDPAIAAVHYGLSCGALNLTVSETQLLTSFTFPLTSLVEDSTYFFAIEAEDALGNAVFEDNDGMCYTFQTPQIPNYFTEFFEADDNDLDFRTILFTPDGSPDVYAPCTFEILDLPTDPAGGIVLPIDQPEYAEITLPPGQTVSLYGVSYSSVFVGGNGYLTFLAGDEEFSPTLAHHFNQPRVSAFFELFDVGVGETISWKSLPDRVAVTWENIPELLQDNSNTFQAEMFYDGRIRLSYLNLDSNDGLVGLSAGTGVLPGFVETDLSAVGSCGVQPPVTSGVEVAIPTDTPVQIQLEALDDGLPDPPGQLSYIITTLPAYGVLSDPAAGDINFVPHTLVGADGLVDYTPETGFQGHDSFEFKVNDGGMPPDGGDSSSSVVSIIVGTTQAAYTFDLDEDPGWSTEGQWAFGRPTGGGSHNNDPTAGFTGANVYGYNLFGDYANDLLPLHLTSTPIDCSQLVDTELRFQRWLGVEHSNYDHANVSVSNDNATWVTVWDHVGPSLWDSAWMAQSFDISDVADGQSTVYLRWTMGPTDDIVTFPGWNIDDIQIWGVEVVLPCDSSVPGVCEGGNDGVPCDLCGDGAECGGGTCVAGPIPAVSQWGMIALALCILTACTVILRSRHVPAA